MTNALHYRITPISLGGHRYAVELKITRTQAGPLNLSLPTWIPGSYLVRDFARHLSALRATSDGQNVRIRKQEKSRWHVAQAGQQVSVTYEVYAFDLSVRGAYLDHEHGFFNASSVFVTVDGLEDLALSVTIEAPQDDSARDWRVATTLPRQAETPEWSFGEFKAASYAELIDHPVEMGHFDLVEFKVAGTPHYFVLSGAPSFDQQRLASDAAKICAQHVALFDELPPMERYLFLTRVETSGYGGLEHSTSTALICSRHALPYAGVANDKDYHKFLGLVSHEYFHLWNVKRIKPAVFVPYELDGESYTEQLWVFEGITSYYDDLAMVRSGVLTTEAYLKLLAATITRVRSAVSWQHQSLADSSFDAWIKFYKPNENSSNSVVSYYAKGAMVALALDLTIRARSSSKYSLDDVMHKLWSDYGRDSRGLPEDGFEELVEQVTGLTMRPFFDELIRKASDVPLEALLNVVCCMLSNEATKVTHDSLPRTSLGLDLEAGGTKIRTVRRDSCAELAGLAAGDELVAIDAQQVTSSNTLLLLMPYVVGDTVQVHAFRRGKLRCVEVCLQVRVHSTQTLTVNEESDVKQVDRRRDWLRNK